MAETTTRTRLCEQLAASHQPDCNLVWSASLNLAWRALVELVGGPIDPVATTNDATRTLIAQLNHDVSDSGMQALLSRDPSLVARAGWGGEFLRSLRGELVHQGRSLAEAPELSEGFHAYGQFVKSGRFAVPLEREAEPFYFSLKYWVQSFGLSHRGQTATLWTRQREQILVHYPRYSDEDAEALDDDELNRAVNDFVVELRLEGTTDRLIVALVRPKDTLADTVKSAIGLLQADAATHPRRHLDEAERFEVPHISLDRLQRFEALGGVVLNDVAGRHGDHPMLGQVVQHVAFQLDEGGARLESSTLASGLSLPPRELRCRRPFLVLWLAEATDEPLFALWVENDDVLVTTPPPERYR